MSAAILPVLMQEEVADVISGSKVLRNFFSSSMKSIFLRFLNIVFTCNEILKMNVNNHLKNKKCKRQNCAARVRHYANRIFAIDSPLLRIFITYIFQPFNNKKQTATDLSRFS